MNEKRLTMRAVSFACGMPEGWTCEEPGWWVHDKHGGVCRERDNKWYGYPKSIPESERIGPFSKAKVAAEAVQQFTATECAA